MIKIPTTRSYIAILGGLMVAGAGLLCPVTAHTDSAGKTPALSASVWTPPGEDTTVTLLVFGQPKPITTSLTTQTQFDGVCMHCQVPLSFPAGDSARKCQACPCGFTNMVCLAGKTAKGGDWKALLQTLPRGTRLRPTYVEADKSESGLKRLAVDRRAALLPVEGLAGLSSDQLLGLTRPLGATRAELSEDGKQLQLTLKEDWTADREKRLEKALATKGARVAYPAEEKPKA